jgi:hypothetical protein
VIRHGHDTIRIPLVQSVERSHIAFQAELFASALQRGVMQIVIK